MNQRQHNGNNSPATTIYEVDVAVVGIGSMGSMALWHLSRMTDHTGRPVKALGIEQFGAVHSHGAFSGETRLYRSAAKEGRLFTESLLEARSQWLELGRLAERQILIPAGVLSVAPASHADVAATQRAIDDFNLPHRVFTAEELRHQYPQFHIEDDDAGLLDELGGALRPEAAVMSASYQAQANGAQVLYNTAVHEVCPDSAGVEISTSAGVVRAGRVIVTAGPWTHRLIPDLSSLLRVNAYALTWFMPRNIGMFMPDRFPGFMRDLGDAHAFGAPSIEGYSVKVSPHLLLDPVEDPAQIPRQLTREQLLWMGERAHLMFPDLDPEPVRYSIHPDSESIDHRPLIDSIEDGRITLATGMSGNGFKLAPVYGQAAAELAVHRNSRWVHEQYSLAHHRAVRDRLPGGVWPDRP